MGWYRFLIHYHGPGGQEETYRYFPKESSEDYINDEVYAWADEVEQDDGRYGYHCEYKTVEAPPIEWLLDRAKAHSGRVGWHREQERFFVEQLRRLGVLVEPLVAGRRQDGILVLPKKEVPEVGYRAIYDWMLTNVHPDLLAGDEKTMSEVVIEILEKVVRWGA